MSGGGRKCSWTGNRFARCQSLTRAGGIGRMGTRKGWAMNRSNVVAGVVGAVAALGVAGMMGQAGKGQPQGDK